ncbi:beta-ketoacyl synthase N-terminal-like domain-containing protein [Limisalsivibrio acetivorans]|uniref:beta-ketoacyl synthase N-terminal-like domain-containing protein n=1 Tax=Limisalsivibrio acetivorans TaxID=1304888 RepID=UPI0003B6767F|nr:beta-ketoacyl synthase N-terminal-like domain-containing protein [Limisalsivibrio acetivorans]
MKKLLDIDKSEKPELIIENEEQRGEVAIIGIGIRIGDCTGPDEFWKALMDRRDFVTPPSIERVRDTKMIVDTAGCDFLELAYLKDHDKFDSRFFRIPPQKASLMDPQEKILLETAWHAAEDAGYAGRAIYGSRTGVFIGGNGSFNTYERVVSDIDDPNTLLELLTPSMTAARISHFLNLKGPASVVDTACSSSLTAVHNACVSISRGECETAIAGACKLVLAPLRSINRTEVESADGRTRPFDEMSDGTGGGEAAVAVFLKPLDKAVRDNDSIYAVIKGSGINQNGRSQNITAPDAEVQADVIRDAWKQGGIDPSRMSFIEAHGTGTKIGDVIEIEGLAKAFETYTDKRGICPVGSVKSNAGHTDNAAGLLGLIKGALSLYHRIYPGTVHFSRPNPQIDFDNAPVYPTGEHTGLGDGELYAGVSSFGLSGTNVHVTLATPPERRRITEESKPYLFTFSAKTPEALQRLTESMDRYVKEHDLHPAEVSATLLGGREHFEHRYIYADREYRSTSDTFMNIDYQQASGSHRIVRDKRRNEDGCITPAKAREKGEELAAMLRDGQLHSVREILDIYAGGAEPLFPAELTSAGRVHLPLYPFERDRHWFGRKQKSKRFSLFDHEVIKTGRFSTYRASAGYSSSWIFSDHEIGGKRVLSGSSVVDQVFELAWRIYGDKPKLVRDLRLNHFLEVPNEGEVEIVVTVHPGDRGEHCVLEYCHNGEWRTVAEWRIEVLDEKPSRMPRTDIKKEFPKPYALREEFNQMYGDVSVSDKWDCLEYAGEGADGCGCIISVFPEYRPLAQEYPCYPPVSDIGFNFHREARECIPLLFPKMKVFGTVPPDCLAFSRLKGSDDRYAYFDVKVTDTDGNVVVEIDDYTMMRSRGGAAGYFHVKQWCDAGAFEPQGDTQPVLCFFGGEPGDVGEDVKSVCWDDYEAPVGVERISKDNLQSFVRKFYATRNRRIVYTLPDIFIEPEHTLDRLFMFLSSLASTGDGELELIIAGREPSAPLHSSAAAIGRAFELERPNTRYSFVQIQDEKPEDLFQLLDVEGFRLRVNGDRIEREILAEEQSGGPLPLNDGERYLITGGLGGIGLFMAEYISERANCDIVLASRSGFANEKEWDALLTLEDGSFRIVSALRRIQKNGCRIFTEAADVSVIRDVQKLKDGYGRFAGVFHFAGTAEDKFLSSADIDAFRKTLAPKVRGALNICEVFSDTDFTILASSLSAITGAPGQAGYAAANAFLDSLAERDEAGRIKSLAWTEWKDVGMAAGVEVVRDESFAPLSNLEAKLCLDSIPESSYTAVGKSTDPNKTLLMEGSRIRETYFTSDEIAGDELGDIELTGAEEFTSTQRIIAAVWGEELGYDTLDLYDDYEDLGGDSITSLGIHEDLQKRFGIKFSFNELFEKQTIADMARYIDKLLFQKEKVSTGEDDDILVLKEDGERKVICFPPGTVYGYTYYDIAKLIDGFSFYSFNYKAFDNPAEAFADITESIQPEDGLILLGFSVGGNLAYEVARVLEKRGREIDAMIFIDNYRRYETFSFSDEEYRNNAQEYLAMVDERYLKTENRESLLKAIEHFDRYMDSRYEEEPVNAPIHYVRGNEMELDIPFKVSKEGWEELTPSFTVYEGSGEHPEMLRSGHIEKNVGILQSILVRL